MSPHRAPRPGAPHSAQDASYARSVTPPDSRERRPSPTTNQSYAVVEACTMDALVAQHCDSMMSAVRPCSHSTPLLPVDIAISCARVSSTSLRTTWCSPGAILSTVALV